MKGLPFQCHFGQLKMASNHHLPLLSHPPPQPRNGSRHLKSLFQTDTYLRPHFHSGEILFKLLMVGNKWRFATKGRKKEGKGRKRVSSHVSESTNDTSSTPRRGRSPKGNDRYTQKTCFKPTKGRRPMGPPVCLFNQRHACIRLVGVQPATHQAQ